MKSQKNLIYQNLGVYWVFFGFQHKQKGTVEFERQSLEIVRMTSEGNSDPGDDFS